MDVLKPELGQVCVCLFGEGELDWGVVGVTDMATAEQWRWQYTKHRCYIILKFGVIAGTPDWIGRRNYATRRRLCLSF